MSRPTKRGFSQNDPLRNNQTEGQCDFSTSSVKRLRQSQSDVRNVSGAPHSTFIPHGALPSRAINMTTIHASSTNIIEPENDVSFHDNIEWPSNLQNDLSFQLPDIFTSHDSVTFGHESIIVGPLLSCTQAAASYLDLPTTSDYSELDELVLHQTYADDTFQSGFGDVHQAGNFSRTGGHFLTNIDMSWMNDVSWDAWDNLDWVTGHSSQAASLSLLPDAACSKTSRFDESKSCSGNHLPGKPYREILPLLQKRLEKGPQEDKSTSNVAESSQRYKTLENLNSQRRPKLGRSKSFAPERASAIAEMRIIKACLRCRIKKIGCSPGEVCDACLTSAFGLERTLCVRNNVDHSTELLFPSIVNSNFHKSSIENLIHENVESFRGNKISIQISSGPTYPPISLWVEEFRPKKEDFLTLPHVKTDKDGRIESRFMRGYTPPLALPPYAGRSLRKKCQEHVDLIAQGPRNEGELYYKHTSIVPWEVYKAIEKYHRSTKDELVGKSITLYAMHFFMTQILLFTEDSADSALRNLSHPAKLPYTRSLTSRLISIQIKQEMYDLAHKATKEVLKLLEDTIIDGSKRRRLWTPSFCAISIICMCMEMVQIATDFKIVHSIIEGEKRRENSRSESKDQCQRLDEYVMSTLETMFHRVFKSRKKPGSRKHERGFNPIRDGVDLNDAQGLDTAGARLVAEIRRIIAEKEKEIGIRLENPSFDTDPDDLSDLLARHLVFREKNSGRLVSRFLRSFFKPE